MAEQTITDQLTAVRMLLREGRTNEADRAIDTIEQEIRIDLERRKLEFPPPGPLTREELIMKFYDTLCDILGNPPRLLALLFEIRAKTEPEA